MNFRLTLVLAIILLLITGIVWYSQSNPADTKPVAVEHNLLATSPKSIDTISLSRDGKTIAAFQKTGDKWALTDPIKAPVDSWLVDDFTGTLRTLTFRDKFAPEPTGSKSLDATGVEPPSATVKFTDDAKVEHTLAIGKRTPVGTRYVRLDKDPDIYEVDAGWFEKLDKDPSDFRSKDLLDISADRVTSITLQRPDQTVQITKTAGKWTITKPITTRANTTPDDMAGGLANLRTESFTDISRDNAGLNPPLLTVIIDAKEKSDAPATTQPATQPKTTPTTLQFGNYSNLTKKQIYASISGSNEVYVLNADLFKKFDKKLFDVRDPAITPAAVDDATALDISAASGPDAVTPAKLSLSRKDGVWQLAAPAVPADSTAVSGILSAIKNLRANKFLDSPGDLKIMGLDPADKTISMTLPNQTQRETILIGHSQPNDLLTPVQRQGEPTVYLVQTADLAKLSPSALALRDKSVAKLSADSIRSITASGPALTTPLALLHSGSNWTTAGKTADSTKITTLLTDLDPVTAGRWVSVAAPTAAPAGEIDIVTDQAPATAPATLPAAPVAGPTLKKQIHHTLRLFKTQDKDKTTWAATFSPAADAAVVWTFEPTATLIDHLTKTSYEVVTTAPATAPATNPEEPLTIASGAGTSTV